MFRTLQSEARTLNTKPDISDICYDVIIFYSSDNCGAGLDANNVVVTT
jgi:hypothetical protein